MANEISNISHAAMVVQTFEDGTASILNSWGVVESTLARVGALGIFAVRLTVPLSLRFDAEDPRKANFSFITTVQGLALPNYVAGQPIPDPFAPPPPAPTPGGTLTFGWLSILVTNADNIPVTANAVLQIHVRRIPNRRS